MKNLLFAGSLILLLTVSASAQLKQTENTWKLAEGQTGEKASISDMSWLAGTWAGEGLGGVSEEIWSKPQGGIMIGMYRMMKVGKPVFYELLTLSETDGTLLIRLKHFHANFVGWEEKEKTVDFRFIKRDGNRIYFEGMTFEPVGESSVKIYLAIGPKDGSIAKKFSDTKE
jgi:hypothetical protein